MTTPALLFTIVVGWISFWLLVAVALWFLDIYLDRQDEKRWREICEARREWAIDESRSSEAVKEAA